MVWVSQTGAQKGGAKGAMRNRGGKGGGSFGGGGNRNIEEEWDGQCGLRLVVSLLLFIINIAVSTILQHYDYTKPRPCVGLCYIMKLRGGPKPVYPKHPPEERTACVGMCHRDRVEGVTRRRWRQERKKKRKVCVGACHNKKKKLRMLEKRMKKG